MSAAATPAAARTVQTVRIVGEMTILNAVERKARLLAELRKPYVITELDLSQVTEIDTSGVQLLLLGCNVALAVGGALRIVSESDSVRSALDLLHLRPTLEAAAANEPTPGSAPA